MRLRHGPRPGPPPGFSRSCLVGYCLGNSHGIKQVALPPTATPDLEEGDVVGDGPVREV